MKSKKEIEEEIEGINNAMTRALAGNNSLGFTYLVGKLRAHKWTIEPKKKKG